MLDIFFSNPIALASLGLLLIALMFYFVLKTRKPKLSNLTDPVSENSAYKHSIKMNMSMEPQTYTIDTQEPYSSVYKRQEEKTKSVSRSRSGSQISTQEYYKVLGKHSNYDLDSMDNSSKIELAMVLDESREIQRVKEILESITKSEKDTKEQLRFKVILKNYLKGELSLISLMKKYPSLKD